MTAFAMPPKNSLEWDHGQIWYACRATWPLRIRCDNCMWSDTPERFLRFGNGKTSVDLCVWCRSDSDYMSLLFKAGWKQL